MRSATLSRNKNRSSEPDEIAGTAIKKQLAFRYAELLRLREAVQQAEAALRGRSESSPRNKQPLKRGRLAQ
jgi:hypothetical protein